MCKRKGSCFLLALLIVCGALAQEPYDTYRWEEEWRPMLRTEEALFFRAVQDAPDLYGHATGFELSFPGGGRRGAAFYDKITELSGIDVPRNCVSALRMLSFPLSATGGIDPAAGTASGVERFDALGFDAAPRRRASVRLTDRNYRTGARLLWGVDRHDWRLEAAADLRTGRDMRIEGVFTQAVTAALRVGKTWRDETRLTLIAAVPLSVRGLRGASTAEAIALTGDRFYNPSWGFQNGRVRNARVRREWLPYAAAAFGTRLSVSTTFVAAVGIRAGLRRTSALEWFDASTPVPDNYRRMPSFFAEGDVSAAVGARWRAGDARYTQIDWDELYAENRMRRGDAAYVLADRTERVASVQAAATFRTRTGERLRIDYGIRFLYDQTRRGKELRDLLGAQYLTDIDCYLVDDATYRNSLQNDLRRPDRRVGEGDRFGYDYALSVRETALFIRAEYRTGAFLFGAGLRVADRSIRRLGFFEKELFPGEGSFGASKRIALHPYALTLTTGYAFSPATYFGLSLQAAAAAPEADDLFLQPQYNNRSVDVPRASKRFAAEATFRIRRGSVELQATAFASLEKEGCAARRYYDDLASVYCDRVVTGMGILTCGVAAAAVIRPARRWQLMLTASGVRCKYVDDPVVTLYRDTDNSLIDRGSRSYMKGCTPDGMPQVVAGVSVDYFGRRWGFRLSGGYAGDRRVDPDPGRRTSRVARQASESPEAFDLFMAQERLADAVAVNAFVWKSFYFGARRLTCSLSLRNLTGDTAPYGGYEQPRVRRVVSGAATLYRPFDNRYTYMYGRSLFLSISFDF